MDKFLIAFNMYSIQCDTAFSRDISLEISTDRFPALQASQCLEELSQMLSVKREKGKLREDRIRIIYTLVKETA